MGHEFVGTLAEIGKNVTGYKAGERVAVDPIIWCGKCPACKIGHYPACTSLKLLGIDMDGGFAEYVAADASMLYKIADSISDRGFGARGTLLDRFSMHRDGPEFRKATDLQFMVPVKSASQFFRHRALSHRKCCSL